MARWLPVFVYLVLAAVAVGAALAFAEEGAGGEPRVLSAAGDFALSNSRDGAPIFSASELGPGDSASGTVEIGTTGSAPTDLVLSREDLLDSPGPGGGALSAALALRVSDVTASPQLLYSGPLATMPPQPLGRFDPGDSRTFEFVATLPEGGPASNQNGLQGGEMSVVYIWTASEAADPPPQPGGSSSPRGESPPEPASSGARLAVTRIWRRPQHGLVMARAACDRPCAIAVHGELRAWGAAGRRSARIPLSGPAHLAAGSQRLAIHIPAGLRAWLHANPTGVWARAELVFVARDAEGDRVRVSRAPWLRHPRWTASLSAIR